VRKRLRQIHSLTGVIPLGVFLGLHLWTNARAISSQRSFYETKLAIAHSPGFTLFEGLFVWVPLLFHGLYGLHVTFSKKDAEKDEGVPSALGPRGRSFMRTSGMVVLAFIAWHVADLRLPRFRGTLGIEGLYDALAARLSDAGAVGVPWFALVYLVAIGVTAAHLAVGAWNFCAVHIVASDAGRRRALIGTAALGSLLFLLGAATAVHFATGARFGVPLPPMVGPATTAPCPAP
jgi:succinate dehydrogenase / fumarate reductase cytochrome b subunit